MRGIPEQLAQGSVQILRSIVEGGGGYHHGLREKTSRRRYVPGGMGVAGAVTGKADLLSGRRPGGAQQRQKMSGEERGACRRGVGDAKGLYLTKICSVEEGVRGRLVLRNTWRKARRYGRGGRGIQKAGFGYYVVSERSLRGR